MTSSIDEEKQKKAIYLEKEFVRITTEAERVKRAEEIMQIIADKGKPVKMQELYAHFDDVSNRTVRNNVQQIDNEVVKKYRTGDNTVYVTLKNFKDTRRILALRRAIYAE